MGGRPYPRTEAPGAETPEIIEKILGGRPYPRTEAPGTETPEKRLYTI